MTVWEWLGMLVLIGGFATVTEATIRRSEHRIMKKLDRMHEQLIASLKKQGIDPVTLGDALDLPFADD